MFDTGSPGQGGAAAASRRAGRGIAWHLAALCLAIVLPVLVLAGALAGFYAAAEREQLVQAALGEAASRSLALDRDLAGLIAATEVLAVSPSLRRGDLDAFDAQAREVRDLLGVNVVMRDRESRQVVNTRLPRGAALPRNPDFTSDRRVLGTGAPDVSDLLTGAVTRAPLFIVNVPVRRDGEVAWFLNLSLPPERVRDAVAAEGARPGWPVTVVDRRGVVVADTHAHSAALGRRLPGEEWWAEGEGRGTRWLDLPWHEGGGMLTAHVRSPVSGWSVLVGIPAAEAAAPFTASFAWLSVVGFGLVGLSASLAVLFARRIARPVAALADQARRLGVGEQPAPAFTGLAEVDAVARALALAAAERRRREEMLRESDARLGLALEAAGFGRWEVDLRTGQAIRAGRIVAARPGLGLSGYALDEFIRRVVHPEDAARVRASFDDLVAGRKERHRVEYRTQASEGGGWLWVESYGAVAERHAVTGAALRVAGVSRDVTDRKEAEAARAESEAQLQAVLEQLPVGVAIAEAPSGRLLFHNRRGVEILRHPMRSADGIGDYRAYGALHPDGTPYAPEEYPIARAIAVAEVVEAEEMEYRRGDGTRTTLEVSAAPIRDAHGRLTLAVSTFTDIAARKHAEQHRRLLMREVDHRAKNALAVAQSVASLTRADTPEGYARLVAGRIGALARAHTRLAESGWAGAGLRELLEDELRPFGAGREGAPRVVLSGPDIALDPSASAPVAMIVHELATNATKHGALSVAEGRVEVGWVTGPGQQLRLTWAERGGPPVAGPPGRRGFGSRVIAATVEKQLGGHILMTWRAEGLLCELTAPLATAGSARA